MRILLNSNFSKTLFVFASLLVTSQVDAQQKNSFELIIDSNLSMDIAGQKQEIKAKTTLKYANTVNENKLRLMFDEIGVVAVVDDMPTLDMTMSAKMMDVRSGEKKKILIEDANAELKKNLQDSFDTPICEIELDKNGKETKRTVVAKSGADNLVKNGQIENARLFHAPFYGDKKSWDVPSKIPMGNGNFAEGTLKFELTPSDKKDGLSTVKVSGTLNAKGKQGPLEIANGVYKVKGTQTFNSKNKVWESGNWKINISFELNQGDSKIASANGTMNVKFANRK